MFDTVEPEIKVMLINEIFGTDLSLNTEFLNVQTEHNILNEYKYQKDITRIDTLFVDKNTGEKYHIEFQSTPNHKMGLRLLMYSIYSGVDINSDEEIVELCNSHVLYTVNSGSNKKGKILSKLRIKNVIIPNKDVQDISINDIDNYGVDDSRIIGIVSGTTELLAYNLDELMSSNLYPLAFVYFYKYLKNKVTLCTNEGAKEIWNEYLNFRNYINQLSVNGMLSPIVSDIMVKALTDIGKDYVEVLNLQSNVDEEVVNMYQRGMFYVLDMEMDAKKEGRKEGFQQGIQNERLNSVKTLIMTLKGLNHDRNTIITALMNNLGITQEDAEYYMNMF